MSQYIIMKKEHESVQDNINYIGGKMANLGYCI